MVVVVVVVVLSALQAHFFKKSPFGDHLLQNGHHKKKIQSPKTNKREGKDTSCHFTRREKNVKGKDTS